MKKSLILLLLLFPFKVSFGQEIKVEYGNKRFMKYHYHCSQDNGFTLKKRLKSGKYIVYSKENPDLILVEGYYKKRKKNGEWKIFNPIEKLTEYKTYLKGTLIYLKEIDSLGRKTAEIYYSSKIEKGFNSGYYYNRNLRYKDEFYHNKITKSNISKSTYYYENGNLKSVTRYKNGFGQGKSFELYKNGKRKMEYEWNNRIKTGRWKWWNEKGELIKEINYDENNKLPPTKAITNKG